MAAEKTEVPIIAYTDRHRIEGEIVLFKGERMSDKLNIGALVFEPVLRARVYNLHDDSLAHEVESLVLNKAQITLMVPVEDRGK